MIDTASRRRHAAPWWTALVLLLAITAGLAAERPLVAGDLVQGDQSRLGTTGEPSPVRADSATIAGTLSDRLQVYRLAAEPRITVIDFPSLATQAAALNRVAALTELEGAPRDRLVEPADLARLMAPYGRPPEAFYFGHDYENAKLAYFFSLARGRLTAAEQEIFDIALKVRLIRPIASGGYSSAGPPGALLTLSRLTVGSGGEAQEIAVRKAVLDHELAHGRFFVYQDYPEICRHFWVAAVTEQERQRVREILGALGYDSSNEELVLNEAQAYLGFTDAAFLPVPFLGLGAERFAALRAELRSRLAKYPVL